MVDVPLPSGPTIRTDPRQLNLFPENTPASLPRGAATYARVVRLGAKTASKETGENV